MIRPIWYYLPHRHNPQPSRYDRVICLRCKRERAL